MAPVQGETPGRPLRPPFTPTSNKTTSAKIRRSGFHPGKRKVNHARALVFAGESETISKLMPASALTLGLNPVQALATKKAELSPSKTIHNFLFARGATELFIGLQA
ncbi:MAG: hypothetical protein ACK587_09705 [Cyanobacteriota bacterium]